MGTNLRRIIFSLRPEQEEKLRELKKEKFYDSTQSAMMRYLVDIALENEKEKYPEDPDQKPA